MPTTYFEKPKLGADTIVVATALTGEREMTVTIAGIRSAHAGMPETFTLYLPDRRDFIACSHGGMADVYRLEVKVTFSGDATSATATFAQDVDLGGF